METIDPRIIVAVGVTVVAAVAGYFLQASKKSGPVLDPQEWRHFQLIKKTEISPNTRLYRFALPKPTDILGIPIGKHLSFRAKGDDGVYFIRSYTPTTSDDEAGYFDLVIKVYGHGKMSTYIDQLKIGDKIEVRGPKGNYTYQPNAKFNIGMTAGGTGITPMLQIIRAIHKNPTDKTSVSLIYANVNADDILLKEELDSIASTDKRFKVFYVLNNPPEGWTGGIGFISQAMIEEHLPNPGVDTSILMCGPPAMNKAMQAHFQRIGYSEEQQIQF